jgi:hypothetical protein
MGTTTAGVGRLFGRMAAVALVALVLSGLTADPAGAAGRKEAAANANQMIADCFADGGDPEVLDSDGEDIRVECHGDDGSLLYCSFLADNTYCRGGLDSLPDRDTQPLEPTGGPLTRPGLIDRAGSGAVVLAEDSGVAGITETVLAGSAAANC